MVAKINGFLEIKIRAEGEERRSKRKLKSRCKFKKYLFEINVRANNAPHA
jgi:hypothetical protein